MGLQLTTRLYNFFNNINSDSAYACELYLKKRKGQIFKRPISFLLSYSKIILFYGFLRKKCDINLKGTKFTNLLKVYDRRRIPPLIKDLTEYDHIITDLWDFLIVCLISQKQLYKQVEEKNKINGFAEIRGKYSNKLDINQIYKNISKRLGINITPEIELNILKESCILNPYGKIFFEGLCANGVDYTIVADTSYNADFISCILKENGVKFIKNIITTGERGYSVKRLINKVYHRNRKIKHLTYMVASNYKNFISPAKRRFRLCSYYRCPEDFVSVVSGVKFDDESYNTIYNKTLGINLFSMPLNRNQEFLINSLYYAPVTFEFLKYIKEQSNSKDVVFVCSSDNYLLKLYNEYFGEADYLEWTKLAVTQPQNKDELLELLDNSPQLLNMPGDRLANAMGFSAPEGIISNCKDTFISLWAKNKKINNNYFAIENYIESMLSNKKNVLFVDLTENSIFKETFDPYFRSSKLNFTYDVINLRSIWKKYNLCTENAREISNLITAFYSDSLPVLVEISDDYFKYAIPQLNTASKRSTKFSAIKSYVELMNNFKGKKSYIVNSYSLLKELFDNFGGENL